MALAQIALEELGDASDIEPSDASKGEECAPRLSHTTPQRQGMGMVLLPADTFALRRDSSICQPRTPISRSDGMFRPKFQDSLRPPRCQANSS